jgi:predicted permease
MRRNVFDFFAAMQIPVLRGRTFTRTDDASVPPVVVVNATLAKRVFGDDDPIGKRVRFGAGEPPWMTIVGVVGSIKHSNLEEVPKPELYINYRQGPPTSPFLVLRTKDDPAAVAGAVRETLKSLGADSPVDVRTMDAIRSRSVAGRRFVLLLVGLFGVLSLALAALGVFGVITLIATERTTEVGIRLALGATPSQVMRLIVSQALKLAAIGIAIGGVVALIVAPLLKAQLFGVGATDPLTFVGVSVMLAVTAAAAAMLPARRAMRVDPAHALRN